MHVISRKALVEFGQRHSDAAAPLDAWYRIVRAMTYADAAAVKAQFGSASFLSRNRVVFNIGGNKYRLVVGFAYPTTVFVRSVLTHAEYDARSNPDRL